MARAVLRLQEFHYNVRYSGDCLFEGDDLLHKCDAEMNGIRGKQISIAFQDPLSYLNPLQTVRSQMREVLFQHMACDSTSADLLIQEVLTEMQFANPKEVMLKYPFQMSGGMRQRVIIGMALLTKPSLLIADEITASLDARVEREVLDCIDRLRHKQNMAVLLISHNLSVIERYADRIAFLYAGTLVEMMPKGDALPHHPYSRALLNCSKLGDREVGFPFIEPAPVELEKSKDGCPFRHRGCSRMMDICHTSTPDLRELPNSLARCHNPIMTT